MLADFDSRRHLGFMFDCTSREIRKAVNRGVIEIDAENCNVKNGWLLGFLERQTEPVYQKDLEKIFHFPKSTLADMIQSLEKSGYIAKVPVDGDGRKKQIIVTEAGKRFNDLAESQILAVDDYITSDIPPEQIEIVVEVLEKMRKNAMDYKSYVEEKKED
ncbi:DNA-binding transcriptional regulator, MarR family [Pseudobutyrivibrio sp. 49]|uniref:MarR family winged helix-turn-helix transcriptional regulator n=1 Tax=unclassified Pseudobutyrivibrio TaxID=2638619 RepID=UPI00088A0A89|nr:MULTISPECIES: MarR family winged helix-turn-helix transcriptional regulator [unclassified Pseudobutyrivibrio]SDI40332.1 DNA-binding transcriptional regulator, MarR family [Pseudobutyrivibrio sp. 49]SFO05846.1 DNA-binding transcriptional regulator, MarR family [Pseudobutyrivibrio sp. UC1225]